MKIGRPAPRYRPALPVRFNQCFPAGCPALHYCIPIDGRTWQLLVCNPWVGASLLCFCTPLYMVEMSVA